MNKFSTTIGVCIGLFLMRSVFAGHYTERGDYISTSAENIGTAGDYIQILIPLSAATYSVLIDDWSGLKQLGYSAASALGVTYLLKYTTHEDRPRQPEDAEGHTFPSGHTAFAMVGAGYLQMRYGLWLGVPAYIAAAFVGYSRIVTKNHNWGDVIVGASLGIGANLLLTSKYIKPRSTISIIPTNGVHTSVLVQISNTMCIMAISA